MPIVNDTGFSNELATASLTLDELRLSTGGGLCVLVPNDVEAQILEPYFDRITTIVVAFPAFSDGRGFSIAQRLRGLGYEGRLRAKGHVIADQYTYARSCGFDDVEVSDELAARQSEGQWLQAAALSRPYRSKWAKLPMTAAIAAVNPEAVEPGTTSHI